MELSSQAPAASESAPSDVSGASADTDPRLSALPDHLEPLRVLGQGGSSIVYEALHKRLKVKVALKLLTIDGPHAAEARARMAREAELYALLDDPRIPRVYDVNELPDGTPYVVMEMVPGESLEELLLRRGPLPSQLALNIAREVLLALASVHERGVLHRDVKPANVILTLSQDGPGQVRLVDFGIAKMSARGTGEEAVTKRGTLVGTPHYMAPERLAGHPADASTDVYAVGIMLYEMLSGVVPFSGSSLPLIMAAVMRETPLSLAERGVAVTPELSALVMKAMAREPSDRFASARAMLAALDALGIGESRGERLSLPNEFEPSSMQPRRRVGRWIAAGLVSALLVGLGFFAGPDADAGPDAAAGQPLPAGAAPLPGAPEERRPGSLGLPAEQGATGGAAPTVTSLRADEDTKASKPAKSRRNRQRAVPDEDLRYWNPQRERRASSLRADDFYEDVPVSLPDNPY